MRKPALSEPERADGSATIQGYRMRCPVPHVRANLYTSLKYAAAPKATTANTAAMLPQTAIATQTSNTSQSRSLLERFMPLPPASDPYSHRSEGKAFLHLRM